MIKVGPGGGANATPGLTSEPGEEAHVADAILSPERVRRFWARTRRNPSSGCLEWVGNRNGYGYGRLKIGGSEVLAHRVAWTIANGPIPPGLCVLHHCDNPPCVEVGPGHLFLGTKAENNTDRSVKGRSATGDGSGARLHPERRPWGDRNGSRLHPESRPRGGSHWVHLHPESQRGEKNGHSRITEALARAIRYLVSVGETQKNVAEKFGIHQAHVSRIVSRKAWRCVA